MRQKHLFLLFFSILFQINGIWAYSPPILEWQKCYGGTNSDLSSKIIRAQGSGFWLLGNVDSQNGCINSTHGSTDIWLSRLDAEGNILWQKSYGGSSIDFGSSIILKNNKLYIAGYSSSLNGDLSGNMGGFDAWLFCVDTLGTIQWQGSYGGSTTDLIYAMIPTNDGGFLLGGGTYSNDGDVSGNHGNQDFWLLKTDATGNLLWQRSLGGSNLDVCYTLLQDSTGSLYAAGSTNSSDGEITQNRGNYDWMIAKLDISGNAGWIKTYGGSGFEAAQTMVEKDSNTILLGGYTNSSDGNITTSYGYSDAWYITINSTGNLLSEHTIGGSASDNLFQIIKTTDGGFLFASGSSSTDHDLYNNRGMEDIWLYKTDSNLHPIWTQSFGGSGNERPVSLVENATDDIYFTGYTFSSDLDVSANHGSTDIWLAHLTCRSPYVYIQSGNTQFCTGDSVELQGTTNSCSRISWIENGIPTSSNSDPILVHFPVNGTYVVSLEGSTCALTSTNTVTLVASPCNLPNPAFTVAQNTVCTNSNVDFTDLTSGNVNAWQWYFPGGSPSTSTDQNPHVVYSAPGQYSVTLVVTNSNGSQAASMMNYINVIQAPAVPYVTLNGSTISTTVYGSYTWLLNGNVIPFSNIQVFSVPQDGYYQVLVSNGGQCTALSDSFYVGINQVNENSNNKNWTMYPNPATSFVTVSAGDFSIERIDIKDLTGRIIRSQLPENKKSGQLDLSDLSSGSYLIALITDEGKQLNRTLIKY